MVVGFFFAWDEQQRKHDTLKEIISVEKNIETLFNSKMGTELPLWEEIERITDMLVVPNKESIQAKALLNYKENPISRGNLFADLIVDELWENRYQLSKQKWQVQTTACRTLISLVRSIGWSIVTILFVFFILTLVPELWYFILERVTELSQAIQGRTEH